MKMKLQLQLKLESDTHNEMRGFNSIKESDADVLVFAGDIDVGVRGIKWALEISEQQNKPVIYVAGNHEFYGHNYTKLLADMRAFAKPHAKLHFLENDEVVIDGVRFLGATLWTDYLGDKSTSRSYNMRELGMCLNDHRVIRFDERKFEPEDALKIHQQSVKWLEDKFADDFKGKTVVVTHHGPSLHCAHLDYGLDHISAGFLSDLDRLVEMSDVWCFGHTHSSLDIKIGKCRLVSNQKGYPRERLPIPFREDLVIEIKGE